MNITIIGATRIGTAYAIAAIKSGHSVNCIVDPNSNRLEALKHSKRWTSELLQDSIGSPNNILYSRNITALKRHDTDLCIITTPPHTHINLIRAIRLVYSGSILVETPVALSSIQSDRIYERVYISAEWIYHDSIDPTEIKKISMHRKDNRMADWGYNLPASLDFMPHILSLLYIGAIPVYGISYLNNTADEFTCKIASDADIIIASGDRSLDLSISINDVRYEWKKELLELQIKHGGISLLEVIKLHNKMINSGKPD